MSEEKNIKQRLLSARKEILETKVEKKGKNKFSNYDYFTPSQITSLVTKACINHGILTRFVINKDGENYVGQLIVESTETDENLVFTIPTAMPDIKATNVTQKLGGMVTYTQRYLEMVAFGITDNNLGLDSQDNTGPKLKKKASISIEKFNKALEAIDKGDYTLDKLISTFDLDETQMEIVNNKKPNK